MGTVHFGGPGPARHPENGSIQITGEQAVLSGTANSVETFRVAEQFANVMAVEATMPGRLGTLDAMLDDYFLTVEKTRRA